MNSNLIHNYKKEMSIITYKNDNFRQSKNRKYS